MEYNRFLREPVFSIRTGVGITFRTFGYLLDDMTHAGRIAIWRKVGHPEFNSESLYTHMTPKIKKMLEG